MSILSALHQQNSSLDELAKLPQTAIMQMAQRGEISQDMVAPILGKKAEMADAIARNNALQQGGGQQPSVMDQIMQKNAQAAHPMMQPTPQMADAGVAQIPTKEPQYAGGGIVSFADGGDVEDDDYEAYTQAIDDEEHKGMLDKLYGMLGKMPKSYTAAKADADMKTAGLGSIDASGKSGHPYESDAIKAAKEVGLDPNIMLHALYKETGGIKDPATAKSKAGAYGPMQLMEATAKDLGVNRKDPYENILGGAKYLKQQVDTFKDPQLALAAYNAGPGAVRKALSHKNGIASLSNETQGYMKYSAGGDVKGYSGIDGQSLVDNYDDSSNADDASYAQPSALYPKAKKPLTPEDQDYYRSFMQRLDQSHANLKKGAEEDKNLALLQAGLGIMGGTSPYAMANIGQGAMAGANAYGAAKRARAVEQMGLDKLGIAAYGAKTKQESLDEYRKARETQAASELDLKKEAQANKPSAAEIAKGKVLSAINQDDTIAALLKQQAASNYQPGTPEYQYYEDKIADVKNKYWQDAGMKPPTAGMPARNFPIQKIEAGAYNTAMPTWLGGMSKEDLQAAEWANANPTDPRAMAIKQRLGK